MDLFISRSALDLSAELHLYAWTCLTEALSLPWDEWVRLSSNVIAAIGAVCDGQAPTLIHTCTHGSLVQVFHCSIGNCQRMLQCYRGDNTGEVSRLCAVVQHMTALLSLANKPALATHRVAKHCTAAVVAFVQQMVRCYSAGIDLTDAVAVASSA